MSENVDNLLEDFKAGPLDAYRQNASFKWKNMILFLEGYERIKFKVVIIINIMIQSEVLDF